VSQKKMEERIRKGNAENRTWKYIIALTLWERK
jgi:hypothetical protein